MNATPKLEEAANAEGRERARQIMDQIASSDEITSLARHKENSVANITILMLAEEALA